MNTNQALAELGVTPATLSPEQIKQFDEVGYLVIPDVFTADQVAEMRSEVDRIHRLEGDLSGHEVHIEPGALRLSNLFNKSRAFDCCLHCAPTLAAAHYLMGEICVFSLNARNPAKGSGQQDLHSDVPRAHPGDWRLVNTMIMLDDVTEDNGPTRVIPGSHRFVPINVPDTNMHDIKHIEMTTEDEAIVPKDPAAPHPREVHLTGKAGSIAVTNAHIWHGGTRNVSGNMRRLLHLAICRRDIPQQIGEREHATRDLLDRTSPAERYILDIEKAVPRDYDPFELPKEARPWKAAEAVVRT